MRLLFFRLCQRSVEVGRIHPAVDIVVHFIVLDNGVGRNRLGFDLRLRLRLEDLALCRKRNAKYQRRKNKRKHTGSRQYKRGNITKEYQRNIMCIRESKKHSHTIQEREHNERIPEEHNVYTRESKETHT